MIYVRGNEPTPDQRPYVSGFLAACVATIASGWLLFISSSLQSEASALQVSLPIMACIQGAIWLGGGVLFGRVFSRAAADPHGGWLFGISYGYVLWMLGPATTMMWIAGGPVAKGHAAMAVLGAYMLFGLVMGAAYPLTSRLFKPRIGEGVHRRFNAAKDFAHMKEINHAPGVGVVTPRP